MRPSRPARIALAIAALLPLLAGCTWLARRQAVRECRVSIESVTPDDYSILDPLHLDLALVVGIDNPNEVDALLEPFDWRLLVGETEVATGRRTIPVEIAPRSETAISIPAGVDLGSIAASMVDAIRRGRAEYRLRATVHLNTILGVIDYEIEAIRGAWE